MAKIRSGVLGNTRGKVAGVVGSQWKNVNYIREYVQPANPNTAAQQVQRSKMADVVEFAKPCVGPVFNAYTDKFQKGMSGFNYFIKQSISEFDGTPDLTLIKLTEGKLHAAAIASVIYNGPGLTASVAYDASLGNNGAADDSIFGGIYDESSGLWYFASAEDARDDSPMAITMPNGLDDTKLHAYLWAIQYSGTIVSIISDSDYHTVIDI